MSEQAMSQAGPDQLPVPRRSSLKQVALAREILSADLTKDTWTDIFKRAGYAEDTALSSAKDIRERPGVQRAIMAQTQVKLDSARSINGIVAGKLRSRIEDDSASDQLILGAYKVTTDALVAGADEVESIGEHERIEAREYVKSIINAVLVATRDDITLGNFDAITPQLIDSIIDRADRGELTQYTLSDASPPSHLLALPEKGQTIEVSATVTTAKRRPGRPRKAAP